MRRGETTGREVPEDVLMESLREVPNAIQELQPLTDLTVHIDNSGEGAVRLIAFVIMISFFLKNGKCSGLVHAKRLLGMRRCCVFFLLLLLQCTIRLLHFLK